MFVNSIIIKISWIVLPFQNAVNNCLLMYDTLAQEEEQGRHTNVMKTYDAAETNQFIFSTVGSVIRGIIFDKRSE